MNRKAPARTNYRSAKSGLFVTREFAQHHPATTVKEHNLLHNKPAVGKPKNT